MESKYRLMIPHSKKSQQYRLKKKTGARALATTLEKIFRNYKFELPSTNINYIYADKQLIKNPEKVLAECIKKPKEYLKNAFIKNANQSTQANRETKEDDL